MRKKYLATKKYLSKIKRLDRAIDHEMLEAQRLRTLATNISATISGDKVQTSASNRLENIMIKLIEQENRIADAIERMAIEKDRLIEEIELINDDDCIEILKLYFVHDMKYEDLPVAANMSKSKVLYVYNRGLELFERMNGEKYLISDRN